MMTLPGKHIGIAAAVMAVMLVAVVGSAALQEETTLSSPRNGGNWFGLFGVAVDGDTVVVGEPKTNRLGKVYVFVKDGAGFWQEAELDPPILDDASYFGLSVALDGDTLAASQHGRVYVFSRSGGVWSHTATLEGSDGGFVPSNGGANQFGSSIVLRGGLMVVSDRLDCGASADAFGSAISVDSARAVIGGCLASDGSRTRCGFTRLQPTPMGTGFQMT